jgi:threonine/homoserine/homoserine lactone efflux protein
MILAAYGDTLFNVLFLGHMLSFAVAFAPAVVNPILMAKAKADADDRAFSRLVGHLGSTGKQVHFPALVALGGFGIAMVLTSDDVFSFGDTWVSLAFLVWLAIAGLVSGAIMPNERKVGEGDLHAERKVALAGQITTVLLLVMLYLMIWKPGA